MSSYQILVRGHIFLYIFARLLECTKKLVSIVFNIKGVFSVFKKTYSNLVTYSIAVAAFAVFVVLNAQGMGKEESFVPDTVSNTNDLFKGGVRSFYLSLSSSQEEFEQEELEQEAFGQGSDVALEEIEIKTNKVVRVLDFDKCIQQFHIVPKENFDMIETVCKQTMAIIEDYENALSVENLSDAQEVALEPVAFDWRAWANDKFVEVGTHLSDVKDFFLIPHGKQQPR